MNWEKLSNSSRMRVGNIHECNEFFWTLYNFIYVLGTFSKPHVRTMVALIN